MNSQPQHQPASFTVLLLMILAIGSVQAMPPPYFNPYDKSLINAPGVKGDGSVLLYTDWTLRPAGEHVQVGGYIVNTAVHPGGRYLATSSLMGAVIRIVDLDQKRVVSSVLPGDSYYGLAFSPDGSVLYASGARQETILRYGFANGKLSPLSPVVLRDKSIVGLPMGLTISSSGSILCAANLMSKLVSKVDLPTANVVEMSLTNIAPDAVGVTNLPYDPYPFTCLLDEPRNRVYVSLWSHAKIAVFDITSGQVIAHWPTQEHPTEMVMTPDGHYLFVANTSRNTVSVFDASTGQSVETLSAALYPGLPDGCTPCSLCLSPDGKTLFVANSDMNCVAAFDVTTPGESRGLGFIPTGWAPNSVRITPDGNRLLVANAKGNTTRTIRGGEAAIGGEGGGTREHNYVTYNGTVSIIDLPPRDDWDEFFHTNTAIVQAVSPIRPDLSVRGTRPPDSPIPSEIGGPSPIRYCIYIIKENRTYDVLLGDMPEGNGDPNLCIFPEYVTPNHHKLARQFILLDNYYVNALASADGHEWTTGAYCTDFVEKGWRLYYGSAGLGYPRPSMGRLLGTAPDYTASAAPASGYLWDRAAEAGITYRSYGERVSGTTALSPNLKGHFDTNYNYCYNDKTRAQRFISELNRFAMEGDMPRLQIMALPEDHSYATIPGQATPNAAVGRNDLGLGMIVEAVSHSVFWTNTAIFVTEDDTMYGPDHVECHRSVAYVISPYAKRGVVDSTMYNTCSILRTMELILGLEPLSIFDAGAVPMYSCFQSAPDFTPYDALPANVDLTETNPSNSATAALSMTLDLSEVDRADPVLMNQILWQAIKGTNEPYPAPVRAAFIQPIPEDDDDDD